MTSNAIRKLLAAMLVTVLTNFAVAGPGVSGGGDTVKINGKYYLLDLVEAGVETNPYLDRSVEVNPRHLARLQKALNDQFPIVLIAKKLAEVSKTNRVLSIAILKTIEAYQWRVVNKELIDIVDENTDLKIDRKDLFQLAARKNVSILIDRNIWEKIDAVHQVALVFHEALYALDEPGYTGKEIARGFPIRFQSSEKAREINGYLFSDLPRQGFAGFERLAQNFPSTLNTVASITQGKSRPIYEDDSVISFSPYLLLKIENSPEWEQSDATAGIAIDGQGPTPAEKQIEAACAIATQKQLPISIDSVASVPLQIERATFQTWSGPRTYMSVMQRGAKYYPIGSSIYSPVDESSCRQEIAASVQEKLKLLAQKYID